MNQPSPLPIELPSTIPPCHKVLYVARQKSTRDMHFFLSTLLPLVACLGYLGYAQPICQDLKAPFQYGEASYCPEYNGFGCCGKREERKWASYAQLKLRTEQICSDYSRNLSCLSCSSLAGRILTARMIASLSAAATA